MAELVAIDHVQLAMPKGGEAEARAFYGGMLGMAELPKPETLVARGGVWFGTGKINLHLGVEDDFRPAKKAHVALTVRGAIELKNRLRGGGFAVRDDTEIAGLARFFTDDCFGNRLEFISQD